MPDLGMILAGIFGLLVGAVAWLLRLLRSAREREQATKRQLEQAEAVRRQERAARELAGLEREETRREIQRATEDLQRGGKDHFSSPR